MLNIANRQIMPAVLDYSGNLAGATEAVIAAGATGQAHSKRLHDVCLLADQLMIDIENLEEVLKKVSALKNTQKKAQAYNSLVIPAMEALRKTADQLEMIVDSQMWPLPSYSQMLFLR